MAFTVNGVNIKNPSTFKVERYNVTTMERLSNADMVGDLVAQKRKFYFTYEALTGEEFDAILAAIYDAGVLFFPLTFDQAGKGTQSATVYVGSIPADLARMGTSTTVWKNVTFNLIER